MSNNKTGLSAGFVFLKSSGWMQFKARVRLAQELYKQYCFKQTQMSNAEVRRPEDFIERYMGEGP
jgi:hypothetical protein